MNRLIQAIWSIGGFIGVLSLHAGWHALLPSTVDAAQSRWVTVPTAAPPWHQTYLNGGDVWLGLSIASAGAFATWAIRRWWLRRTGAGAAAAVGGLTWTGVLAGAGCFLTGCCGSPMLAVWMSLLGATAIPWLKPLSFGFSLLTIMLGVWWVLRRERSIANCAPCDDSACGCHDAGRQ